MNWIGTVVEVKTTGVYVEVNRAGSLGRFGPMLYLAGTTFDLGTGETATLPPSVGDKVLVTNIGKMTDQFIVVGKVVDPQAPPYDQPQDPYGDGAVTTP